MKIIGCIQYQPLRGSKISAVTLIKNVFSFEYIWTEDRHATEKGMQSYIMKVCSSADHFCFVSRFNAAWFPSTAACNCNNSKQVCLIHLKFLNVILQTGYDWVRERSSSLSESMGSKDFVWSLTFKYFLHFLMSCIHSKIYFQQRNFCSCR